MPKTTYSPPTPRKHSRKRQTVHADSWMPPQLKSELMQIGKEDQVSLSSVIRAFCEEGVKQRLHKQHAVLLPAILEAAIDRRLNRLTNRLAEFLGRSVYEAGQVRWLFVNSLYRQVLNPHKQLTKEEFYDLLDTSQKETIKAIRRWNPKIQDVVSAIKDFLKEEEEAT